MRGRHGENRMYRREERLGAHAEHVHLISSDITFMCLRDKNKLRQVLQVEI